jgi:type I restriction enzyme S subunit
MIAAIQDLVETNLRRADRLRQAILKRAFEGRLVPQDPNDEPAAVLLERLRTQHKERETDIRVNEQELVNVQQLRLFEED